MDWFYIALLSPALFAVVNIVQEGNTNEKWFRRLLSRLSQDINFRKLWSRIPESSRESHLMYNYEINYFTGNWRGKEETLKFHIFAVYPTFDSRFALLIHQPADENTYRFYQHRNNLK